MVIDRCVRYWRDTVDRHTALHAMDKTFCRVYCLIAMEDEIEAKAYRERASLVC